MIMSKTPFRISFAGGGSDLPSYYRNETGAVLSTTINKYMYIAIHPFFEPGKIQLKYSKTELRENVASIEHPIFREALSLFNLTGVDINSIADIPSGTGLGSSSSFTVGLLNALNAYIGKASSSAWLGDTASRIEIDILKSPIGKQDQYAAAFGGLNFIRFYSDEHVDVKKVIMDPQALRQLDDNLIMVYTGGTRSANGILEKQSASMDNKKQAGIQKEMVDLAYTLKSELENNNIDAMGRILHQNWLLKKSLVTGISNVEIDTIYRQGLDAGATGGKLLGAGATGFILFYCPREKQDTFRQIMGRYRELAFKLDHSGSRIIYVGDLE